MSRVLAFDVGKTGCRGAVFDDAVRVSGAEVSGGVGLADHQGVTSTVDAVVETAQRLGASCADVVVVGVAGFAGADHKAPALVAGLTRGLHATEVVLASDMTTWHAGALAGQPGVVVTAGTGSVALAVAASGRSAMCGGAGYLLGDEGSGYAVGRAGLASALRHHDGRAGSALLHRLAGRRYGDLRRLPARVHGSANQAAEVAAFADDVRRAAEEGDEAAVAVWRQAGQALAELAAGAARSLEQERIDVTTVGGLWAAGPLLAEPFRKALEAVLPAAELTAPRGDALEGARLLGVQPSMPHQRLAQRFAVGDATRPAGTRTPLTAPGLDAALCRLDTERARDDLADLDTRSTAELVRLLAAEDAVVPRAVAVAGDAITAAVDVVVERLRAGGRMVYLGAGTSGRLAVVDAAELLPTYGVGEERVVALIAGGVGAVTRSVEGAEDDESAAERDLESVGVCGRDAVVGVTASGRTPYVLAGVRAARRAGAATVGVSNNEGTELSALVDVAIEVLTGPEVVAGSTRMKAGTAQKLVLNTLSTVAMIRLGKVHGNRMVDMHATNEKLRRRARRIVSEVTGADADSVEAALVEADGSAKTAIVILLAGVDAEEARLRLERAQGSVRTALREVAR